MALRALAIAACAGAWLAAAPIGAAPEARVEGRVELGVAGLPLAAVAPVVIHLEPLDRPVPPPPDRPAEMSQRDARFAPPFLVVAVDQRLDMLNDDAIYHNVFSYSRPNAFDLGLYPGGESRRLWLEHPGVVKLYCSIHESMSATILVVPTRWFAVADDRGAYSVGGLRPGRYRAVAWSEKLPRQVRELELVAGRTRLDWTLGTPATAQSP